MFLEKKKRGILGGRGRLRLLGVANEKRRDDHEGYHNTHQKPFSFIVLFMSRAFHTYSISELPLSLSFPSLFFTFTFQLLFYQYINLIQNKIKSHLKSFTYQILKIIISKRKTSLLSTISVIELNRIIILSRLNSNIF